MAYLVQRGVGAYDHTGNWTWEYYPPPYDFLAPADSVPMPAPILFTGPGLGCACGGACGGAGTCRAGGGLGLFEAGFDLNEWGVAEWAVVAGGAYLALKLLGDVMAVRGSVRKYRRKRVAGKRARLQKQLEALA